MNAECPECDSPDFDDIKCKNCGWHNVKCPACGCDYAVTDNSATECPVCYGMG
jgi:hypothetical protein